MSFQKATAAAFREEVAQRAASWPNTDRLTQRVIDERRPLPADQMSGPAKLAGPWAECFYRSSADGTEYLVAVYDLSKNSGRFVD